MNRAKRTEAIVQLERLKRNTSILPVAERYGILADYHGANLMAQCPFHPGNKATLQLDPIKNRWHCTQCDRDGGVIELVMQLDGITFREAVDKLITHSGLVKRASALTSTHTETTQGEG